MKIILFSAHPDDEVLGAGGLISRLRRESSPEIKNYSLSFGNPSQVETRRQEVIAACDSLGIESKDADINLIERTEKVCDIDSKKLRIPRDIVSIERVFQIIKIENPDLIITHHNDDAHPDHIAANYLVSRALNSNSYSVPVLFHRIWKDLEEPNFLIEISKEDLESKAKAMRCHESEVSRSPGLLDIFVYANAKSSPLLYCERILGWGCPDQGITYAEPFQLVYFNSSKIFQPSVLKLSEKLII